MPKKAAATNGSASASSKKASQSKKFDAVIERAISKPANTRETRSGTRGSLADKTTMTRNKKEEFKKAKSVISKLAIAEAAEKKDSEKKDE